jgi:formate dehydrogenase subunit delta
MSDAQHLAQMANDIGHFFCGQSNREDAIAAIANHIRSYWTPRMRQKLTAHLESGDAVVEELPREALFRLAAHPDLHPKQAPGGDAG